MYKSVTGHDATLNDNIIVDFHELDCVGVLRQHKGSKKHHIFNNAKQQENGGNQWKSRK